MDLPEIILSRLGLDKAKVMGAIQQIEVEYAGFKRGFQTATAHYNAALKRIENNQARILALLERDENGQRIVTRRTNDDVEA